MKLHANASLSLRQRHRMVCRVVDDSERHPGSLVEDLRRALDELEDLAARHIAQAGATKPRADS